MRYEKALITFQNDGIKSEDLHAAYDTRSKRLEKHFAKRELGETVELMGGGVAAAAVIGVISQGAYALIEKKDPQALIGIPGGGAIILAAIFAMAVNRAKLIRPGIEAVKADIGRLTRRAGSVP